MSTGLLPQLFGPDYFFSNGVFGKFLLLLLCVLEISVVSANSVDPDQKLLLSFSCEKMLFKNELSFSCEKMLFKNEIFRQGISTGSQSGGVGLDYPHIPRTLIGSDPEYCTQY